MSQESLRTANDWPSPTLIVGQDREGRWVVQDRGGLRGGWFVGRAEAIRYAMFETGGAPRAVLLVADVIEPTALLGSQPDKRRVRPTSAA